MEYPELIDKSAVSDKYADDITQTIHLIASDFENIEISSEKELEKIKIKVTKPFWNYFIVNGFSHWIERYNVECESKENRFSSELDGLYCVKIELELFEKDYYLQNYHM